MGTCDERSIVNSAGACKASRVPDEGGTLHLASLSFDREWQALSDREGRLLPAPKQPKYCVDPRDNGNTALVFPALSRSLRNVGCRVFRPASVAYDSRPRIRQLFVSLPNAPAVNMFSPTPHLLALSLRLLLSLSLSFHSSAGLWGTPSPNAGTPLTPFARVILACTLRVVGRPCDEVRRVQGR